MPRLGSTLLSLALAGAITLAAYTDPVFVGAAVLLVQVLIALAPSAVDPAGHSIRSPHFAAALSGGLVATAITLAPGLLNGADGTSADVVGATDNGMMAGILPAIAASVFVALIAQMLRSDGRPDLVPSTAYAVALGTFAALSSGWIGAAQSLGAADAVAVGAGGLGRRAADLAGPDRSMDLRLARRSGGRRWRRRGRDRGRLDADVGLRRRGGLCGGTVRCAGSGARPRLARGHTHAAAGWGFPGAMSIALAAPLVYVGGQLVGAPGL